MTPLDPTSFVKGAEKLVAIYGRWPSFHDAEVTSIRLDRGTPPAEGASAYVSVHLFEGYRDGPDVRWGNHAVVTFRFVPFVDLVLEGFNHQNGIMDLTFEDAPAPWGGSDVSWQGPAYRVRFARSFGVGLSFVCGSVEVVAIDRSCPPGSVYA